MLFLFRDLTSKSLQLAFSAQGYASTMRRLHTVSFHIVNTKRRKITLALDMQKATEIMVQGPPQLRRLTVNGIQWEVGNMFAPRLLFEAMTMARTGILGVRRWIGSYICSARDCTAQIALWPEALTLPPYFSNSTVPGAAQGIEWMRHLIYRTSGPGICRLNKLPTSSSKRPIRIYLQNIYIYWVFM